MNHWTTLYTPPAPPPWQGDVRVHVLSDVDPNPIAPTPKQCKPKVWRPWTVVRPGSATERLMQSLGYAWEFPK